MRLSKQEPPCSGQPEQAATMSHIEISQDSQASPFTSMQCYTHTTTSHPSMQHTGDQLQSSIKILQPETSPNIRVSPSSLKLPGELKPPVVHSLVAVTCSSISRAAVATQKSAQGTVWSDWTFEGCTGMQVEQLTTAKSHA
jgi:hypothetical protein